MNIRTLLTALVFVMTVPSFAAEAPVRTIGVLIYDKVLTSDVTAPLEVFGNAVKEQVFSGYRVVAIAPEKKPITTEEGLTLVPEYGLADAPALDVLIVGSAYDMEPILSNTALISWVAARGKTSRWLASNCSGARILGDAGLLVGKRATTYPGGELAMKARYLRTNVVSGERFVVDGNLVTSNGGLVSYAAALKLLALMTNAAFAEKVSANLYYDRLPPVHRATAR
jgi:transcriptional regulator GlxA family with amidase domain